MALRLKNRVQETTATTGTGAATLSGAPPTGFQTFANALTDGDTTYYQITDGTDWEIGLGTFISATNELQRTEVFESSNNNAKVSFGAGSKDVFIVMPAEKVSGTTSYGAASDLPLTANQVGDQAFVTANNNLYIWSGSGWYKIATVNQTPTISGNIATYELAADGTATVVTLTGTDPEGFPLTWAATESGDTGIATTTNVDNVFTITPVTDGAGGTMTVTFSASDGVNTATANSTFTLTLSSQFWKDVALSVGTTSTSASDNSTFIDRSTNAHTVGLVGTPVQTAFHPYFDYWAVSLHSNAAHVTIADDPSLDLTGEFTIEVWYKQYSYGTNNSRIFQRGANSITGYCLLVRDDGTVKFGRTDEEIVGYSQNLSDGKWHHHAVTRDASNNVRIFFDGVLKDTATLSSSLTQSGALHIGAYPGGTSDNRIDGDFSNFRLVTGSALYTSNFTPSTTPLTDVPGTQVLTLQDNRFVDNSSNNLTVTPVNEAAIIPSSPFVQESEYDVGENKGSVYLATGDEVVITHDSSISAGTGDFCLQFWVYGSSGDNAGYKGLVAKYSGGAGGIWFQPNNGVLVVGFGTGILGTGTKNVMDNGWHHIAWTRSGSANKVFVDGVQDISFTASDNLNNTASMLIGDMGGLSRNFQGYVADLKYDVGNATYTSAFTPPTSPVGNTNASLYLPMDNAGVFDKTGLHNVVLNGTTVVSSAQSKYASSSLALTNRTFKVDYSPAMSIGANDFTMEMWVYPTDSSGGTLWSAGYDGANRFDFGWQGTSGIRLLLEVGNVSDTVFTSSTPVSNYLNQWTHIALVRSANTFSLYVNGGGHATGTSTKILISDVTDGWTFGGREFDANFNDAATNDPFYGYIEGVQFTRAAKYTAPFSVPTQEQGLLYQAES